MRRKVWRTCATVDAPRVRARRAIADQCTQHTRVTISQNCLAVLSWAQDEPYTHRRRALEFDTGAACERNRVAVGRPHLSALAGLGSFRHSGLAELKTAAWRGRLRR